MAKVSYKNLYEDSLKEIDRLNKLIKMKDLTIKNLSSNPSNKNMLEGLVFRDNKFWKEGKSYNSVQEYINSIKGF
jgi:hypothetical protein